ncbi:hypothetical protein KQI68_06725 [Peptoniphilus sp. MSJ-1]|uniref:Uncharacterized protein n=1 Tax=Peptoniphilus ovalis TaxID=2841503 RepID=A0ABS6FH80_9FIRM|nr:hypothetical protein [Peptoniphilus ovalis]MBU5669532.1 hypothetical protein [Peptoniphilus ovalis]
MMNPINPLINKIEDNNKDLLQETMNLLVEKFNSELKKGNIEIKSTNEFTRLATLMLQMRGEIVTEEVIRMPDISNSDEKIMDKLYNSLINTINDTHDEENKS